MGGQLDGNFLPGSLPHKFILIVILIICFAVNKSEFSLCVFFISIRFFHIFSVIALYVCLSVLFYGPRCLKIKLMMMMMMIIFFSLSVCSCTPVSLRL